MTSDYEAVRAEHRLTSAMAGVFESGHPSLHSARVLGHLGVVKALQRRGLVGADRRWTRKGLDLAPLILVGRFHSFDDLHTLALEMDSTRSTVRTIPT